VGIIDKSTCLQIVKIVPNLPNGLEEVEKAAGHEYY
jgi:hypothetical protein